MQTRSNKTVYTRNLSVAHSWYTPQNSCRIFKDKHPDCFDLQGALALSSELAFRLCVVELKKGEDEEKREDERVGGRGG